MQFPKFEAYEVTLVVTKMYPHVLESGDPNDCVVIKLGPSQSSLKEVAVIYNVPNDLIGMIRHEVTS